MPVGHYTPLPEIQVALILMTEKIGVLPVAKPDFDFGATLFEGNAGDHLPDSTMCALAIA